MAARKSSRYLSQRDRQVLDHLLSIADSKGRLTSSTYAIAIELGLHRQTLSRILVRLAKADTVVLADHSCTPIRMTGNVTAETADVTHSVTPPISEAATYEMYSWFITYTIPCSPHDMARPEENVTDSAPTVTPHVTDKEETKQKNEETPPAPPQEEKKQNKEENTPTLPRAYERKATDEKRLEQRRQHFIESLQPFATRYGQEMIGQFADYWTEPNRSSTRMRFELQRTWNTALRLARWARNDNTFHQPSFNNYHDNHYNPYRRPTSADYIREAQEHAIAQTEQFIQEAERRRGGLPPHLPF